MFMQHAVVVFLSYRLALQYGVTQIQVHIKARTELSGDPLPVLS